MFSYKAQVDDVVEDDNVSLPHQLSCSSLKTDSDYIYQVLHFHSALKEEGIFHLCTFNLENETVSISNHLLSE